jgi:hypothetical protein
LVIDRTTGHIVSQIIKNRNDLWVTWTKLILIDHNTQQL